MWKVKRMNKARIVVLSIAVGAGGIAAYLASGSDSKPPAEPVAQLQTVDVLVAKSDIGLGQSVVPDDLVWQTWPAASASNSFIRRSERPDATKEVTGSIARAPFIAGEPIREPKLVKANGSGFMAAILPNDRVDVILSKRDKNPDKSASADIVVSEIILTNVRVLAIDQAPKEKDGQNAVVGKTVTLELKPEQAETLARARQTGTLALALRSIADLNVVETKSTDPRQSDNINVVRYGVSSPTTVQK
jgi:pilus assembly protein CpaB